MRTRPSLPNWAAAAGYQFAGGAALAVGLTGVLRPGTDRVLGIVLILLAVSFVLRGVQVGEAERRREADSLRQEISRLAARAPDEPRDQPTGEESLFRWLRRRFFR